MRDIERKIIRNLMIDIRNHEFKDFSDFVDYLYKKDDDVAIDVVLDNQYFFAAYFKKESEW